MRAIGELTSLPSDFLTTPWGWVASMFFGAGLLFGPLVGAAVWLYLRDFLQDGLGLGAAVPL